MKHGERENTEVFLQKKIQLCQRFHQEATGDVIVPIFLELLKPAIRLAIRTSQPKDFDTLLTRALEAGNDKTDMLCSASKKEEKRTPNESAQSNANQRKSQQFWHCPNYHLYADCALLRERNAGIAPNQNNWRVEAENSEPATQYQNQN